MSGGNRTGRVSSVDYEAGTYEVTYFDRGQSVTKKINSLSNGEYKMPKVGQMVSVSHNANGTAAATAAGSIWNKTNRPVEGYAGLYRKEYGDTPGAAYERFDENTGEYSQYLGSASGRMARISEGEISDAADGDAYYTAGGDLTLSAGGKLVIRVGGITVEIAEDGGCTIGVGDGSVSVSADGNVSITGAGSISLSAPAITINGTTVSIAGANGSAVIGGKSLTAHTHTDSYGGSTSGPN